MPAERVGQPNDHVEESRDVDRIDERVLPHARGEDGLGVLSLRASGRSVSFSRNPSVARRGSSDGRRAPVAPDRLPDLLAERYDATAPCDPVQNGHWLTEETNAAKSSRSPTLQSDAPFIARSSVSE